MKNYQTDTLFLDRDGVINVQLIGDYVKTPAELELREDFLAAAPILAENFHRIIIVTNQQCIDKGLCTRQDVDRVHEHLLSLLSHIGFLIDAIYVCPHVAGGGCACRKPETGMLQQALHDFPSIDIGHSVMVGDSPTDMQFGHRGGLKTVYIGKVTPENSDVVNENSDIIAPSLLHYAQTL